MTRPRLVRHPRRVPGSERTSRIRRTAAAAGALALVALAAGCGAGSRNGHGGGMANGGGMMGSGTMRAGSPTAAPPAPASKGAAGTPQGRGLFLSSGCGGCHTLADAGTTGTVGPDLDQARPGYALVVRRVHDGAGAMPSFAGTLTDAQISAIARYVAAAAR